MGNESAYIAGLIAGNLMGAGFYINRALADGLKKRAILLGYLIAIALRLVFSRAFTFFARVQYLLPTQGWLGLLDLHPRGLSYIGSIAGLLLGGFVAERLCRISRHRLLDLIASGAMLSLAIGRTAEVFVCIGQGSFVENPAMRLFPFAVKNEWGEWYIAVFMLEALIVLLILWDAQRLVYPAGERWQRALFLFFCAQMLCESLLAETIKWGFVRVHQLFCAISAAALLLNWVIKGRRHGLQRHIWLTPLLLFPCVIVLLIGLEFALDRWQNTSPWTLYLVMASALALLAGTGIRLLRVEKGRVNGRGRMGI